MSTMLSAPAASGVSLPARFTARDESAGYDATRADVASLGTLFVGVEFIFDLIAFLQRLKAFGLDRREVDEDVPRHARIDDEAETLSSH